MNCSTLKTQPRALHFAQTFSQGAFLVSGAIKNSVIEHVDTLGQTLCFLCQIKSFLRLVIAFNKK